MILIRASLETGHFMLAGVAAAVGLLTVVLHGQESGSEAFWKPEPTAAGATFPAVSRMDAWMLLPIVAMAVLTVLIGLSPEPLYQLASKAADELLEPGRLCFYTGDWEYPMNLFFIN